jgi:hypothetical protein
MELCKVSSLIEVQSNVDLFQEGDAPDACYVLLIGYDIFDFYVNFLKCIFNFLRFCKFVSRRFVVKDVLAESFEADYVHRRSARRRSVSAKSSQ